MNNSRNEAVLFMCGRVNTVVREYAKMLEFCQNRHLSVVNLFFDTSAIKKFEEKCFDELLDYLKHTKSGQAVVFYGWRSYLDFPYASKLVPLIENNRIVLAFASDNVVLY